MIDPFSGEAPASRGSGSGVSSDASTACGSGAFSAPAAFSYSAKAAFSKTALDERNFLAHSPSRKGGLELAHRIGDLSDEEASDSVLVEGGNKGAEKFPSSPCRGPRPVPPGAKAPAVLAALINSIFHSDTFLGEFSRSSQRFATVLPAAELPARSAPPPSALLPVPVPFFICPPPPPTANIYLCRRALALHSMDSEVLS